MDFDDDWSEDEDVSVPAQSSKNESSSGRVGQLEAELEKAKADVKRLQNLVQEMTDDGDESDKEQIVLGPGVKSNGKGKGKAVRDDDTHYFDSYEHNGKFIPCRPLGQNEELMVDIHEIMLRDTTRTVTYARFLLSNPKIFQGAMVMDVGCGTGILSSTFKSSFIVTNTTNR